jgi:hypothetical protein
MSGSDSITKMWDSFRLNVAGYKPDLTDGNKEALQVAKDIGEIQKKVFQHDVGKNYSWLETMRLAKLMEKHDGQLAKCISDDFKKMSVKIQHLNITLQEIRDTHNVFYRIWRCFLRWCTGFQGELLSCSQSQEVWNAKDKALETPPPVPKASKELSLEEKLEKLSTMSKKQIEQEVLPALAQHPDLVTYEVAKQLYNKGLSELFMSPFEPGFVYLYRNQCIGDRCFDYLRFDENKFDFNLMENNQKRADGTTDEKRAQYFEGLQKELIQEVQKHLKTYLPKTS